MRDVFQAHRAVLHGVFEEFANWQGKGRTVSPLPFSASRIASRC